MKAVILAAGKGTRMGELTNETPKPMLNVHGKPILQHIMEGLKEAGIRDFFIVTGYRADVIESYFGDGKKFGVRIEFGRQLTQDGTGKAPEVARAFVGGDDFVLTYGDILVRPPTYGEMVKRHAAAKLSGVITCTGSQDVTKGAILLFDNNFSLRRLIEKPTPAEIEQLQREGELPEGATAWYNAGIYIFKPLIFDFTATLKKSPRGEYELTDAIMAQTAAGHKLAGLEIQGRWVDVRDPQVLAELENGNNG